MDSKVVGDEFFIDRWVYHKPKLSPDENGNIVVISKASFGPLEVYEWGIDSSGKPYKMYKWCENDFCEVENYVKNITFSELIQKTDDIARLAADNGFSDWARLYAEARIFCEKQIGGAESGRSFGNSE